VPSWEAYLTDNYESPRVIVYYTDSQLDEKLAGPVRKRIKKMAGPIPIISVSQKPLDFGKNICVGEKPRVMLSMFEQMLEGLKAAPPESIVYFCEHDVFYHPSHFAYLPKKNTHAYFNTNRYHYRFGMEMFLKARGKRAYSQGVAYREMWIKHIETRIEEFKVKPHKIHIPFINFISDRPNVDMRHGHNLTPDGEYKRDWLHGNVPGTVNLPGWGRPKHFEKAVGYKKVVNPTEPIRELVAADTAAYLKKKFRRSLPQMSPIRCIAFTRDKLAQIFADLGFKRGAEIGVREGFYSENLCKTIPDLELLCVDMWEPYPGHRSPNLAKNHYKEAQDRLEPYNTTIIKFLSMEAVRTIHDESLDFVYIDAAHRFDNVMQDLIEWSKKVRPGGIVSGHDYYRGRNNGVLPAVDAYTYAHQIHEWYVSDEKEASFFWVKQ